MTWLDRLELDPSVPIKKLSRGNRQKIGVVAAFMGHEPLLVMDEPTTGLDPLMQREFLARSPRRGPTAGRSSSRRHNLQEVERACERVAIIREGRLVEISTVAELLGEHWRSVNLVLAEPPHPRAPSTSQRRAWSPRPAARSTSWSRATSTRCSRASPALEVHDIAITTPDVEDLFLRYYRDRPAHAGHAEPPTEAVARDDGRLPPGAPPGDARW